MDVWNFLNNDNRCKALYHSETFFKFFVEDNLA